MDISAFVEKWERNRQKEISAYHEHFLDVCALVGAPTPNDDPDGYETSFQTSTKKRDGSQGYADVWYKGRFAMEYKGKGKNVSLAEAYEQLQTYRENLHNPPLLVVCDIERWEIHTNFTGSSPQVIEFNNVDLLQPSTRQYLHDLFFNVNAFRVYERQALTKEAGASFAAIVESMEKEGETPEHIANYLTRILFCLFADSIGMLPLVLNPRRFMDVEFQINNVSYRSVFRMILAATADDPGEFRRLTKDLFYAMANGRAIFIFKVAYFDGTLFEEVYDPGNALRQEAVAEIAKVADLEWRAVDPSIFGSVFERTLQAKKRAQLGAHYTSETDISLIVEPVLMAPFQREWAAIQPQADALRAKVKNATSVRDEAEYEAMLKNLRDNFLLKLRSVKVLDPACGSGNFLYVSLRMLLDLEYTVLQYPAFVGLESETPTPEVHPRQLYGIEKDEIAHALASIVVWIGYWQWRFEHGYNPPPPGSRFRTNKPYMEPLTENIICGDAILAYDANGNPIEPEWPAVDVIIGNPPFLGAKKILGELEKQYVDDVRRVYESRLPGFSDLVTFWFERSRVELSKGRVRRVGLLATNSIGMGTNLPVMRAISQTGSIFFAESDREWILDGAAVRVAMIGFDNADEKEKVLNGIAVPHITPDLRADIDLTAVLRLTQNLNLSFIGTQKSGSFEIESDEGQRMLDSTNASGFSNSDVVYRWVNGSDLVRRNRNLFIVDFPRSFSENDAAKYEAPYKHVTKTVKPARKAKHFEDYPFWLHWRPRPQMLDALNPLTRYIASPRVSKHRIFVWLDAKVRPDSAVVVFARQDDYFFGVLHSRLHEVWSLRMGTWLGKGNDPRYTPTTTFETFPFPWPPGQEPTDDPRLLAIAAAAKQLHAERAAWLDPDGMSEADKRDRTLTNLYNALNDRRGIERVGNLKPEAKQFAPRLDELHQALDRAVCAAYGWPHDILGSEEAILQNLLALNLERAATGGAATSAPDEDENDDTDE